MTDLALVRDLLDRTQYDLARGWTEAASNALGRAVTILKRIGDVPR